LQHTPGAQAKQKQIQISQCHLLSIKCRKIGMSSSSVLGSGNAIDAGCTVLRCERASRLEVATYLSR
jgi:hypothetical protein